MFLHLMTARTHSTVSSTVTKWRHGIRNSVVILFLFVLPELKCENCSSWLNLMIDLLISLPVSLRSCLLLSCPCLRITDVLGCVCQMCVCGIWGGRGGGLVAGLSCIFSQRLKQRRDDVTAFRIAVAMAAEFWLDSQDYVEMITTSSGSSLGATVTHPLTAFTPILAVTHKHTYTHFTVKHPDLLLLTDFSALS